MILEKALRGKPFNGEQIKVNIKGKTLYCRDGGDGPVSKNLIFVTWFDNHNSTCIGVHRDNFSKTQLKTILSKF